MAQRGFEASRDETDKSKSLVSFAKNTFALTHLVVTSARDLCSIVLLLLPGATPTQSSAEAALLSDVPELSK